MAAIPFADRLGALGLDHFPAEDRADLERLVHSIDEAAARVRASCSYDEEPSNVFRLTPAGSGAR